MTGIDQNIIFSVCRLRTTFNDDIGAVKSILGTGFWISSIEKKDIFVTNKHNIDPKLKLGEPSTYVINKIEIELRRIPELNRYSSDTEFLEVSLEDTQIIPHDVADVTLIVEPEFINKPEDYRYQVNIKQHNLANTEFFNDKVALMDAASFLGFPGGNKSQWWDQKWNLGVARMVNIASHPAIPFTHDDIKTDNTVLVSGLSFSGSSGSVVVLHQKGVKQLGGIFEGTYVEPMVIGIMSGHWPESVSIPGMFNHSGLSYFTRANSILELLP